MDLKGKRVLVYGTGRSGIGAADLIAANGALPVLFDEKKADEAAIRAKLKMPEKAAFLLENETLSDEEIQKIDLVVMSPGVPLDIPNVERFREASVKVIGAEMVGRRRRNARKNDDDIASR